MNNYFLAAIWCLIFLPVQLCAQEKTFFQAIAGNWEGTLEYQDYSADKRVKLRTYLTVTPSPDGNSAEFLTVYDDFGRIIKDRQTYKIDLAAGAFAAGDSSYRIESVAPGRLVVTGSGQDGATVERVRRTIAYDAAALTLLKETREPWQFRNQLSLKRSTENVLEKKTFAAARLREDFEVLKKTLTAIHPGIYRYRTKEALDKLFAAFEAKITDASEADFFKLIAETASQLNCGHTYLNPYNQNALLRERLTGGKTYLPFYFRIIDGKMIVTENASSSKLSKGSEITRLNGVAVRKIIAALLRVTSADGTNTLAHRLQSLELTRFRAERYALFDWFYPLYFPLAGDAFAVEATDFATGRKLDLRLAAMTKAERTAEIAKRYGASPTYDDGWKFEIQKDGTAYLKIENSLTWRLKKIDFKKFLAAAFTEIRRQGARNLIVDLRGNDGGDTEAGLELSRYLAKSTLPVYLASRRLVRNVAPREDLLRYLDTYSDELKNTLRTGIPSNVYKKADDVYFEILPNENVTVYPPVVPYEQSFAGTTYIISDASNASAAFQFLNYAQTNRLGTIVGQATGGNKQGINGGNYFFLFLPNSKIEIDIPVYFFAPFEPQQDESVMPDVSVKREVADIGGGVDREIAVIKKMIGKK